MEFFAKMKIANGKLITALLSVFLCLPVPCTADIVTDFKPIDGWVVKVGQNEVIIDLDAKNGVHLGDVFSVIGPGEELVHPVTHKIIGKLEKTKGVLRVVRIEDGYSFAQPIGDSAAIKRGDPIRRFAVLKAVFWDYGEKNRPLYDHLQKSLTSLHWQDYQSSQLRRPANPEPIPEQNDTLLFIVQDNVLEVRDARFDLLQSYSLQDTSLTGTRDNTPPAPISRPPVQQTPAIAQPVFEQKAPPLISYGTADNLVGLSDNTVMADLLQMDGRGFLATTDGRKISIFSVEKQLTLLAEGKTEGYGKILAVKWWQPKADGAPYLAALAWRDDKIDSTIFTFKNNVLTTVSSGLDTILGSFDLDQDGRPETLLSQKFQAESFFGQRIREMYWQNSQLTEKSIDVQLPAKFTVIGGQLADLTGDGKLEAIYVRNGTLWIYSGKRRLYVSPPQMGGSLSTLTYKIDPTLLDYRSTSVFFEIAPVAVDVDGDGRKELLAISSDQSAIKAPGMMTTVEQSRIVIFNYDKGAFVRGIVGEPIDAAIQGLGVEDGRILFVATDPGTPLSQRGASRLRTLQLALSN